jgi:UDP-N-acetylglucosamine 2-epimerase (non-hydrolysing)
MAGSRPRVLIVIGTRPEGIKLAPVIAALEARRGEVETRTALTGQHTHLMDQVLQVFRLDPGWDLGIMREGQDLYDVTHACLDGLRRVCGEWRPDAIIVEGDTASVFLGSLVGFYERVRLVGHVEAGLRSHDKWQPYPEEVFRRLTGVIADVHFAPTPGARDNLLREGVPEERIHLTGNTVVDALATAADAGHAVANAQMRAALSRDRRTILMTSHRREAFGEPMRRAFLAIRELVDTFPDTVLVYPVHPNPNVRAAVQDTLAGHERILLTEPFGYLDLVAALKHASLVITDSGGIQEEAPTFRCRVMVLREVTERPEAVTAGFARLVGTDPAAILAHGRAALGGAAETEWPVGRGNPYGDGRAGERIADLLVHRLTGAARRTTDWEPA